MILNTEEFSTACQSILTAIDSKNASLYTETMELVANGNELCMSVTNREYFCTVKFMLEEPTQFRAAINAELFLKLISKITSSTVEITKDESVVKIKGNGVYKIPIIFNNDAMFELPKITISNVTETMNISSSILQSILQHNSKELQRGVAVKPVQKYFYIDNKGCITFTSGACVNSFTLEKNINVLVGEKIVKLFKLFKDVEDVEFKIGKDTVEQGLVQTKASFIGGNVEIVTILADAGLVSEVPVDVIRSMTVKDYGHNVTIDRKSLLEALVRLMLFNTNKNYGILTFDSNTLTIKDWSSENLEKISFTDDSSVSDKYEAIINMNSLYLILNGCEDETITVSFGDHRAFVIKKQNVSDIIPEQHIRS